MSLTQIGLLIDVIGFVVIFLFGGFSFGIDIVVLQDSEWWVLVCKIVGGSLVVLGFVLQIIGAAG